MREDPCAVRAAGTASFNGAGEDSSFLGAASVLQAHGDMSAARHATVGSARRVDISSTIPRWALASEATSQILRSVTEETNNAPASDRRAMRDAIASLGIAGLVAAGLASSLSTGLNTDLNTDLNTGTAVAQPTGAAANPGGRPPAPGAPAGRSEENTT